MHGAYQHRLGVEPRFLDAVSSVSFHGVPARIVATVPVDSPDGFDTRPAVQGVTATSAGRVIKLSNTVPQPELPVLSAEIAPKCTRRELPMLTNQA